LPARRVLAALTRAGFHEDGRTLLFAVHDRERIGPKLLAKILRDARISAEAFRRLTGIRRRFQGSGR
jgi:hypothetical protein